MQDISIFNLKPKVARLATKFILKCRDAGFNIEITEGFRTLKRQAELYAQGRTKPGAIVTNAGPGQSLHNYGVAFDVVFIINGKRSYKGSWEQIGAIAAEFGLEHGDRGYVDLPHFQYRASYSLSDFQNKRINEKMFL